MKNIFLFIFLAIIAQACSDSNMEITVLKSIKLEGIPSGSGIAKAGDTFYVIGDDSPFLYSLNSEFEEIAQTQILDSGAFLDGRIAKALKPDFETLEMISENELVVFGSGSKSPQRDVFLRVLLSDSTTVERYDASGLYANLKQLPIFKGYELNIEAAAFRDNHLFLFNRKKNLIIKFQYNQLLAYLKGEGDFPIPEIKEYFLPKINGIEAGFSGATALQGEAKIIFTASVENTTNAYDDGEILGSFIGVIDISGNDLPDRYSFCQMPNTGGNLKVESVTVSEEISPGKTKVVLITDDDKGNSILIESEILYLAK